MTQALAEAQEAERQAERIEGELATAREIQASLLPSKIPQIPGYEIFPYYRSAKEVGGDYYDFFAVDRERIGLIVADVSGKGIPGAMVMSQTRTTIRLLAPEEPSAARTLSKANAVIAREIKRGMFVTCLYAILNVRTRQLTVCSAGHNPMILWRQAKQSVDLVNPNGIALGFDRGPIFDKTLQEVTLQLNRGDRAVLYTDGVVEAMSPEYEEYGDNRFYKFVRDHAQMPSKDMVIASIDDLDKHKGDAEQHDDITLVTFRVQ
jgi:sigma-B regulation protein RsbU (phosphoserine phosphatase)